VEPNGVEFKPDALASDLPAKRHSLARRVCIRHPALPLLMKTKLPDKLKSANP
jgi:hypothetical protein